MMSMKFVGNSKQLRVLYPPKAHCDFIKSLYEPLGLPREFRTSGKASSIGISSPEVEVFQRTGVQHITVVPSKVDWRSVENAVGLSDLLSYVLVNLTDPACPNVCERFEDLGFVIAGVIPEKDGEDRLILTPPTATVPDPSEFVSPRARELVSYVREEQSNDERVAPPVMAHARKGSAVKVV
jgi:hypothetical protein